MGTGKHETIKSAASGKISGPAPANRRQVERQILR
jgi:hypothetical protein